MHILFCDNGLAPFLNFRGYIARYYHDKGYNVSVAVPKSTCDDEGLKKIPIYLTVYPLQMNRNSSNPLSDLRYFHTLYRLFSTTRPDIIFLYTIKPNIYGSIAARMLKIPVVAMVAGLGYAFGGNGIVHQLGRALYKYGLSKADRVIVLNRSNRETLIARGFVKPEKLILFEGGEGVDLDQFPFQKDDYNSVRFLMVARVLYDKGYSEYTEAARIVKQKYPNVKIELLGPLAEDCPMGVPRKVVEHDHNSGAITYLGETDNVPRYVGANGVVVVVVSSYHEGFNRSLMEACAMGRICITSNIPGCKEIVDDGLNGLLVNPKDSQALADAMIRIIESDPKERVKMSHNSHDKAVKVFDVNRIYAKYDQIIKELISQ